jgi:hypothetical protein
MCIPFQCKTCWMRNLENREPVTGDDDVYVACIKCANLNGMLGKSPLTIQNHARESRSVVKNASLINKTPTYYTRGPFRLGDAVGMGLAVDMELKLLVTRGCIHEHVQFLTLQRLRASHTKNWESSPLGVAVKGIFHERPRQDSTHTMPISV